MAEEWFYLTGLNPALAEHRLVIDDGEVVDYDLDDAFVVAFLDDAKRIASEMGGIPRFYRYKATEQRLQYALRVANGIR